MKTSLNICLALICISASTPAFATGIRKTCTDASRTVSMPSLGELEITASVPSPSGPDTEKTSTFRVNKDVKLETSSTSTIGQKVGCASNTTTTVESVSISMLNGEKMPNTPSTRANDDGSLSVLLLCEYSQTSMPAPGACK